MKYCAQIKERFMWNRLGFLLSLLTALLIFVAIIIFYFLSLSNFPQLPGPTLKDYLPGGIVFSFFKDSSKSTEVLLQLIKQHGEIFQIWLGPNHSIVTSVPADILHLITDTQDFDRPEGMKRIIEEHSPGSLFTTPRSEHAGIRRKLRENFNHSLLPHFHAPMLQAIQELVDNLTKLAADAPSGEASAPIDINQHFSTVTLRVLLNVAFGGKMNLSERLNFAHELELYLQELYSDVQGYPIRHALTPLGIRDNLYRRSEMVRSVARKLVEVRLDETVDQKQSRPTDLLDALVTLDNHDKTRIMSQVVFFIVAGAHTTNLAMAWSLYHVVQQPHIYDKVQQEVDEMLGTHNVKDPITNEDIPKLDYL